MFSLKSYHSQLIIFFIFLAVGYTVYFPSISNPMVWDDLVMIQDNQIFKNEGFLSLFGRDLFGSPLSHGDAYYRPIQMVSYYFDHMFWSTRTFGFHLTNIFVHVLASFALFLVSLRLMGNKKAAAAIGLLHLVHPVNAAAVSYLSGRADALSALFVFLSILFYMKYLESAKWAYHLFSLSAFVFAVLSKETALILPVVLIGYHVLYSKRMRVGAILAQIALITGYAAFRIASTHVKHAAGESIQPFGQRLQGAFAALYEYSRLLFMPLDTHMGYGIKNFKWSDFQVMAGVLILTVLLWLVVRYRKQDREVSFGIFWFLVGLVPVLNLYPPLSTYMAEHWLYMPSAGLYLAVCGICAAKAQSKISRYAIGVLLLISVSFFSWITILQNARWSDPILFYQHMIRYNPSYQQAYHGLANIYYQKGMADEALNYSKKSIQINPDYAESHFLMALLLSKKGETTESFGHLRRGLELSPNNIYGLCAGGYIFLKNGMADEAVRIYSKAVELRPDYDDARAGLSRANLYLANRSLDKNNGPEAENYCKAALEALPNSPDAYNLLGVSVGIQGRKEEAIQYFLKAIKLRPKFEDAKKNLDRLKGSEG